MLAIIIVITSRNELCRTAEIIPIGIPTIMLKPMAAMVSSRVVGKRSINKSVTGLLNRIEFAKITLRNFTYIGSKLNMNRAVQAVAVKEILADRIGSFLPQDCPAGVTRDQARDGKGNK